MNCITLLSDFGLQDASVAAAKGILLQHVPAATVIDISHLVEPFHTQQAAYLLLEAYKNFPQGTCHILLLDVFSEKMPRLLLCEKDGYFFLAPDNGVLSLAFGEGFDNVWCCFEMDDNALFKDWLHAIGRSVAALHAKGKNALDLKPCALKVAPQHWQPLVDGDRVECHVIHIDRFENVVINLTKEIFETVGKGRPFSIQFMRDEEIKQLSTHYYNVQEGEKLCRFNETGYLEIAINRGKAASLLGLQLHRDRRLMYNTIKVYFE